MTPALLVLALTGCTHEYRLSSLGGEAGTEPSGEVAPPPAALAWVPVGLRPAAPPLGDRGDLGDPPADTGDPLADTGGPPMDTGEPPMDTGDPPMDTGDPADTGEPADTGDPVPTPLCAYEETWNGHRYLYCSDRLVHLDAMDFCAAAGMTLVILEDSVENSHVTATAMSIVPATTWSIGFTDMAAEGQWVWADGRRGGFTRWNWGEPNNSGGTEDCAVIRSIGNGTWNDLHCDRGTRPFVCEEQP